MATALERMQLTRARRKRGVMPVQVEVSRQEIDFLAKRGYGARADDPVSVSQAVSSFLGDSVLEATA